MYASIKCSSRRNPRDAYGDCDRTINNVKNNDTKSLILEGYGNIGNF